MTRPAPFFRPRADERRPHPVIFWGMTNHPTPGPTSRPARIGFGLMWRVAPQRAAHPRTVLLRRFAFLLLLGIGHQFLQPGEALLPYAIVALVVLLPATFIPERWLAPVAAVSGVALTAVALALDGGLLTIPGLFLLGFALALYDVPRRLDRNAGANGVILIAAAIASAGALYWQNIDPMAPGFSPSSAVAGLAMALMYVALLNFLMSTPLRAGVLAVFAPLGRMSLTNYIGATLLFIAAIPLRPAIGAEGDSPSAWAAAMGVVSVILVAQWSFSALWLRYFRQGPLEWVWRRATWAGVTPPGDRSGRGTASARRRTRGRRPAACPTPGA